MRADKELVKKVIDYMNEQTDSWLYAGGKDVTIKEARFSFRRFAHEHNLLKEAVFRLHDTVITCPFHEDASPSFSFNDEMHVYKCFSCERHGNYASFLTDYDTDVIGRMSGFYQKVNEILIDDLVMQAALGFSTIFVSDEISLKDGLKKFKPNINKGTQYPTTHLELSSMMIARGCSVQEIKLFILLMQSGSEPADIYRELYSSKAVGTVDRVEQSEFDLGKIMMG